MKYLLTITFLVLTNIALFAQNTQTLKGQILDAQSETPLIGASVEIIGLENTGTTTDYDGYYLQEDIPLGRYTVLISYLGYETSTIPNVPLDAGKQTVLNISLTESLVKLDELTITAEVAKNKAINELSVISARQFSMEEVNRYSGGRSDVGRLASNYAGVGTSNDSRNDIVVRGNSPTGVLWRLEGIPIPSPNHFSTVGTTGGPVSALNTNLLDNSDFLTSAFNAEYGNALAGVFDLGFRKGNKDEYEFSAQIGAITGVEALAEGPISKKNNSSFLVSGRYSFLQLAQSLELNIGTNAVPNYRDLSFNFDFGKSKLGRFSLFGVVANSDIAFLHDEVDETDLFAADDEDSFADSRFHAVGLKHNYLINNSTYIRTIIATTGQSTQFSRERFYNQDTAEETRETFVDGDNTINSISANSFINTKHNASMTSRVGVLYQRDNLNFDLQSAEFGIDDNQDGIFDLLPVLDFNESVTTIQPYLLNQWKLNEKLSFNSGIHGLYNSVNEKFAIEPRFALQYKTSDNQTLSLGYGLHHQLVALPLLLAVLENENGIFETANKDLDYVRSNHYVIGYDLQLGNNWRAKAEVYYQDISNVAVEKNATSFSTLNVGADFGFPIDRGELESSGTGQNYGLELTLEKFYSQGYYLLMTGSLFDSKYVGSDGIERNTAFNTQYVYNLLAGKEFKWGKDKKHRLTFDTKFTTSGGRYFTPVDLEASSVNGIEQFDEENAFSERFTPYLRLDFKVGVKFNHSKNFAQSIIFDIQNVTNNENIFSKSYNRNTNMVNDINQIGFFPNFMYRIDF